jgi:hypothetical protein
MASDLIRSRNDFHRVLDEALAMVRARIEKVPAYGVYRQIEQELQAMKRWTANDRAPTEDERREITLGPIAIRELEPAETPDDQDFITSMHELNYYFDNWPADPAVAAEG